MEPTSLSEDKRIAAARRILEHLATKLNARFAIRLWDGSMVPMGQNVDER
ncbi:MAG: hypothetical protein H7Y38_04745, partial [Armatimonadetes bacterium]|nr:hypothetical protein [Armatimonadota bacterium]